ncbi:MAG: AAA family ATPase [Rickettsiales bacterium]
MSDTRDIEARLQLPRFIMMSGTYCAGKSTWTENYLKRVGGKRTWVSISFDGIVDDEAQKAGLSASELMQDKARYNRCTDIMLRRLEEALSAGENIVLDNTNTTVDWRASILALVDAAPQPYHKTAVSMQVTKEEGETRFHARNEAMTHLREDQKVPVEKFHRHYAQYHAQPQPDISEGFDLVLQVPTDQFRAERWQHTVSRANSTSSEQNL